MANRSKLEQGDVFRVSIEDSDQCTNHYFQYIMEDSTLFDSDVIRVFDFNTEGESIVDLQELMKSNVKFHTHISIVAGIKLGGYERIGNVELESNIQLPYFRETDDHTVDKSDDWFIWKPNGDHIEIGELNDETRKYDVGGLFHPIDFLKWLKTGDHGFEFTE